MCFSLGVCLRKSWISISGMRAGKRASDHCWIHGRGQLVGIWLCQLAPSCLHGPANTETFAKCLYNSVSKTVIGILCVGAELFRLISIMCR